MPNVLLAAAAAAVFLPSVPASAKVAIHSGRPAFASEGTAAHGSGANGHGDWSGHRRHHSRDDGFAGAWYYDSNYDPYRSWEPDSYNDWWHDRPDRAYPRWMSNNQDCKRLWSGGGWRC